MLRGRLGSLSTFETFTSAIPTTNYISAYYNFTEYHNPNTVEFANTPVPTAVPVGRPTVIPMGTSTAIQYNYIVPGVGTPTDVSKKLCLATVNDYGVITSQKVYSGTVQPDFTYKTVRDSAGNIYTLGPVNQSNPYEKNQLLKFDSNLNFVSGIAINCSTLPSGGTYKGFYINDIAIDASDNIYVVGTTLTVAPKGAVSQYNYNYGVDIKLNTNLSITSSSMNQTTSANGLKFQHVLVDASLNKYIVGYVDTDTTYDIGFVAKFNSSNVLQWIKNFQYDAANVISITDAVLLGTDVYCLCSSYNYNTGTSISFMMKITSAGAIGWQKTFTAESSTTLSVTKFLIDGTDIFLTGSSNQRDANNQWTYWGVIINFSATGTINWSRRIRNVTGGVSYIDNSGIGHSYEGTRGISISNGNFYFMNYPGGSSSTIISLGIACSYIKVPKTGIIPGTGTYVSLSCPTGTTNDPMVYKSYAPTFTTSSYTLSTLAQTFSNVGSVTTTSAAVTQDSSTINVTNNLIYLGS